MNRDEAPDLVRVLGDPASPIWLVQHGTKRHIVDWETFQALGYDLNQVRWVTLLDVARLPNGPPLVDR